MTEVYLTVRLTGPVGGESEDRTSDFVKRLFDAVGVACAVVEVTRGDPALVSVSYSPQAIRAHFEGEEEAEVRLRRVSDAALFEASAGYLAGGLQLWDDYHGHCEAILAEAEKPADDGRVDARAAWHAVLPRTPPADCPRDGRAERMSNDGRLFVAAVETPLSKTDGGVWQAPACPLGRASPTWRAADWLTLPTGLRALLRNEKP